MSRNRLCYSIENWLFGIHKENFHLVHHLWPRLPAWKLEMAHGILMEDEDYKKLHDIHKGFSSLLKEITLEIQSEKWKSIN